MLKLFDMSLATYFENTYKGSCNFVWAQDSCKIVWAQDSCNVVWTQDY